MIIPVEELSEDALSGVIEEWLSRQTQETVIDYDQWPELVQKVRSQLKDGRLLLTWDADYNSLNIQSPDDLNESTGHPNSSDEWD